MMSSAIRFIVITVPPRGVWLRVDEVRRRVCSVGGSRAALAYPPHVTLRTGALVPVPMVNTFLSALEDAMGNWDPFPVRTGGLLLTPYRDRDVVKHLVGYRIVKDEALASLNERLLRCTLCRASDRLFFEPHMTLAFDDLDAEGFARVGDWIGGRPAELPAGFEWTCDNVGLYWREEGSWLPYKVWRSGSLRRPTAARAGCA